MAFNKKLLVPAAISSQLDNTGEERIHLAPYPDTFDRNPWTIDLGRSTYAYLTRDNNSINSPYLFLDQLDKNTMTVSTLGSVVMPLGYQQASITDNGTDTIFVVGAGSPGTSIYPVYHDGSVLTVGPEFTLLTGGGFSTFCDTFHGKAVGNTLFVSYQRAMSTSDRRLCVGALDYDPNTHILTAVAEEVLFSGNSSAVSGLINMTLHNEYIVAFNNGQKVLYILSYDSNLNDFTLIDSISLPNAYAQTEWSREGISSDGTYIYVGSFISAPNPKTHYVVSFDGVNLSIVDSFLHPGGSAYNSVHSVVSNVVASPDSDNDPVLLSNTSGVVDDTILDTIVGVDSLVWPFFDETLMFILGTATGGTSGVWSIQNDLFVPTSVTSLVVGPPGTTPSDSPTVRAGTLVTDITA